MESIRDMEGSFRDSRSPISQKMLTAISLLRQHESEGIWIDQLCVNQQNFSAKMQAINSMDIIYRSARLVVIVLEDVEMTREELRAWKKGLKNRELGTTQRLETATSVLNSVRKITDSRWLSRAWCYQEYTLSRNYVFLIPCGGNIVLLSSKVLESTIKTRGGIPGAVNNSKLYNFFQGLAYRFYEQQGYRSVADVLIDLSIRRSCFSADKVSMVLNICGFGLAYNGTHVNNDEFCYICILLALAEGDVNVLCHTGDSLHLGQTNNNISWACWPETTRYFSTGPVPDVKTFQVFSPHLLLIDLFFLDGPLRRPSEASLRVAMKFHEKEEFKSILESITFGFRRTAWRFVDALATGLDCGLEWIITTSKLVYDGLKRKNLASLVTVYNENRARSLQVLDFLEESLLPKDTMFDSERRLEIAEHLLKYVVLLFAFELPLESVITIGRLQSLVPCATVPAGCRAVVARDFASPEFISKCRFWFVKPTRRDGEICWKVVGKGLLFHTRRLTEHPGVVALRKRQRIVG
jgi:hypothetical protein